MNVIVTNLTGSSAVLQGWIDYDQDGQFENAAAASELARSIIADGTDHGIATLRFPEVPDGLTGRTYARFRLASSGGIKGTGTVSEGEVEDYVVQVVQPARGAVFGSVKITHNTSGGPALDDLNEFGQSMTSIGDVDGDSVIDIAVGVPQDDSEGTNRGSVYVLFMNADGTVKSSKKIGHNLNGGPSLLDQSFFGRSVATPGDLDADGTPDLVVGSDQLDAARGKIYVMFLNPDGSVRESVEHTGDDAGDYFGKSLAAIGDLNRDGIGDLAVGSRHEENGAGKTNGTVNVLFMSDDGSIKGKHEIGIGEAPWTGEDSSGFSLAGLGDLDGDGNPDVAVGAQNESNRGVVYVLFMNSNGTLRSSSRIAHLENGGPSINLYDRFGSSLAAPGDLDGDGVADLLVGSSGSDIGGPSRGSVQVLYLNSNGTVDRTETLADGINGGPALTDGDLFGESIAALGDLNGDGVTDIAVGAIRDDGGGNARGASYILFLGPLAPALTVAIDEAAISELGGNSTVTVTRHNVDDTSQPLTVYLSSDDTTEATVPTAVTIPANQVSTTFEIIAVDDDLLDGTQTVTVTASASDYLDGSDMLDLLDHETLTLSIVDSSISEDGGRDSSNDHA